MKKWPIKWLLVGVVVALVVVVEGRGFLERSQIAGGQTVFDEAQVEENLGGVGEVPPHPLSVESLRAGEYPGSEMVMEQALAPGSNYSRYIASYKSEGLKIYGLLTVPVGDPPEGGFPAIIFNHGYIPPEQYRSAERYVAYTDGFSRAGYVLFRPDYRGHGNSEGEPRGAYGDNGYTIDVLNAVASVKKLEYVNADKMGMWGHSLGGFITLRVMVVSPDIRAGVIWGGVVGDYGEMYTDWWVKRPPWPTHISTEGRRRTSTRRMIVDLLDNRELLDQISSNTYVADISGPVQLHHAKGDETVPYVLSQRLEADLQAAGKEVELNLYEGDDHNLSGNFGTAMRRSVAFFDAWVKGGE